ncbi:uncharacterized protein TNCV_3089771 [Trichonephila clavipes]|nr:uncharacterized protein TNCV_732811 [Trichonephila clavipes]GFW84460.1 uncharacterized protein TNCV_3089771 [Trichonephila clavipes]
MPPRRNKEKFQQLTEFEQGKIIGLREEGFSYHAIGARVQWNSSTVMRVWKQWIDEHRKTGGGRWKVMPACDDRHLLRIPVNDRTASSRQLVYCYKCTNVGFVNLSTSAALWIACKAAFI